MRYLFATIFFLGAISSIWSIPNMRPSTETGVDFKGDPLEVNLIQITNVSCFGLSDGSITIEVIGGIPPYAISWSNGQITETISNLVANTYSVTVVDGVGETVIESYQVTQPSQLTLSINNPGDLDCVQTQITLTANGQGGSGSFSYAWSTGQSGASIVVSTPNTYIATVTDANNCTATNQTVVNQNNTAPTIDAGPNLSINCPGQNVQLEGSGPIGGQYQISWSTSNGNIVSDGSTYTPTVNQGGTYTLTVVDLNNGCISTDNMEVSVLPAMSITLNETNVTCFGTNNGSITANVTGGTPGYTYNWSNGQSTQTISNLSPGNYTVTVSDTNGCTSTASRSISQPTQLSVNVTTTQQTMVGTNDGTATANATGGTGSYSYVWNTGATTAMIAGLAPGTYTVTVSDQNNCTSAASGEVNAVVCNMTVQINTTATISCFGANDGVLTGVPSSGTSPFQYNWSNGGNTATISNLSPGGYSLTVEDAVGCTQTASASLTQPTALNVSLNIQQMSGFGANDGSISANPTGGTSPYQYNWSNGATSATISNLSPGTYTVTVMDSNNCQTTASGVINEISCNLAVTLNITNPINCFGNSTGAISSTVTGASGTVQYAWSNGASSANINNLPAGTYTITVTDDINCTSTAQIQLTQPSQLQVNVAATGITGVGANDGTCTANPQGGTGMYQYLWNTGATTQMISNLSPGTYTVTVSDANGCTALASGVVNDVNCNLNVSVTINQGILCFGNNSGHLTAVPTGASGQVNYLWNTGATNNSIQNLPAGMYAVTATDNLNCSAITDINLSSPSLLDLFITSTGVTGVNTNDATATAQVSGGTPGYQYLWNTGGTTSTITGLSPGVYSVTTTDSNGCTNSDTVTIADFQCNLNVSIITTSLISCNGSNNGVLEAVASGGAAPFLYNWSNGTSTSIVSGLGAGNYTVTVEDNSGCTASSSQSLTEPSELLLSLSATNVSSVGANDGSINTTISGGTPVFTYLWSNGSTTQNLSGLSPGTYTLTATDNNGCTAVASATIAGIQCNLQVSIVLVNDILCFGQNNGVLTAQSTGGNAPVTYLWNNGSQLDTISNLTAGTYSVIATDHLGCIDTASYQLSSPPNMIIQMQIAGTTGVGANDGAVTAVVTGGVMPYSYTWSNGDNTPTIDSLSPGNYTVTVTDANGCTKVANGIINPFGCDLEIEIVQTGLILCFGDSTGTLFVEVEGAAEPIQYNWSNGTTGSNVASGLPAGEYYVTVTDDNNCAKVDTFIISQPPILSITSEVEGLSGPGANDGSIMITGIQGGVGSYSISWSTGQTVNVIQNLAPGEFCATITDSNGCERVFCFNISPFDCHFGINISIIQHVSCHGGNDGRAQITLNGGIEPFEFNWGGMGNVMPNQLSAGDYSLVVTDSIGCTTNTTFTINEPEPLSLEIVHLTSQIETPDEGEIIVEVQGGVLPYNFQWYFNDIPQTTMDPESLTELSAGIYRVEIRDANGCMISLDSIIIELVTSTNNIFQHRNINLFPNPADHFITVQMESLGHETVSYHIRHMDGKLIHSGVSHGTNGTYQVKLDQIQSGIYLLEFHLPEGNFTKVFVKQ